MNVSISNAMSLNKSRLHIHKNQFEQKDYDDVLLNQIRGLGMTGMTITGIFFALPSNHIGNFYVRSIAAYIIYNAVNLSFNIGLFHNFLKKLIRVFSNGNEDFVSAIQYILNVAQNTAKISVLLEATLRNRKRRNEPENKNNISS